MLADVIFSAMYITDDILPERTAVVIDVLRATSTIVTALANGAKDITPCLTPNEAFQLREKLNADGCLLCGERKALVISGFDLGNTPREYTREKIGGKHLITTTTNGTKAILAASPADTVILGSILNSKAVAEYLANSEKDAVIICSGTAGTVSYDDVLAAGCIMEKTARLSPCTIFSDSALIARQIYREHKNNLARGLMCSRHGKRLASLGLEEDIEYCAREDLFDIIPVFYDGKIKKLPKNYEQRNK